MNDDLRIDLFGDDADTVLRERRRILGARHLVLEEKETLGVHVLVRRGDATVAIPIDRCSEVRRVVVFTAPGCGPTVPGVFQVRARALTLVDLEGFDGSPEPISNGGDCLAIIVSSRDGEVGLRIDAVDGAREIQRDEIDIDLSEDRSAFVAAMTSDLVQILDVDALLASPAVRCGRG